jgi:hypothetical protein
MAVRVSGPGSPIERYQIRQLADGGQAMAAKSGPSHQINPLIKLVDAGTLTSLAQSYYAAEAAMVRLGRGFSGANEREGVRESRGRSLSAEGVLRLLRGAGDLTAGHSVDGDLSGAEDGLSAQSGSGATSLVDVLEVARVVTQRVSDNIRGNQQQAISSHGG